MSLFIITEQHSQSEKIITEFAEKFDLITYAEESVQRKDNNILAKDTISDILEKLYDCGIGHGARHHTQILKNDALMLLRGDGVIKNNTFLEF